MGIVLGRQKNMMEEYKEPLTMSAPPPMDVVGQHLAPQLGTDPKVLARGEYDMRRLSYIKPEERLAFLYSAIKGRRMEIWKFIHDYLLNINVSVRGRGRYDIIRMEGVSKGGLPPEPEQQQPGWFARNILRRKSKSEEDW